MIFKKFRKSLIYKCSEILGNGSKLFFRSFYEFLQVSENFRKSVRKSSVIIGKIVGVIEIVRKRSHNLKSFELSP